MDTPSQSAYYVASLRYGGVAAASLVIYDIMITIDKEIHYFWENSFNIVKLLYLLNRYYGLAVILVYLYGDTLQDFSNNLCEQIVSVGAWCGWSMILLSDAIMAMRVHALFGRTRMAATFLGCSYLAQGAAMLGMLVAYNHKFEDYVLETPRACGTITPAWFSTYWIPTLIFEFLLLCMTIYKSVSWGIFERRPGSGVHIRRSLYHVLLQHQILYFVSVLLSGMVNIALWNGIPEGMPNNEGLTLSVALPCVLGGRILIGLREIAHEQEEAVSLS